MNEIEGLNLDIIITSIEHEITHKSTTVDQLVNLIIKIGTQTPTFRFPWKVLQIMSEKIWWIS